jgi:hypothetical protein
MVARCHKVTLIGTPNNVAKDGLAYLFLWLLSQCQGWSEFNFNRLLNERNLLGRGEFSLYCRHALGLEDDFTLLLFLSEHRRVLICEVSLAIYPEVLFALGKIHYNII